MKKYRLLKDLPGIKRGAMFTDERCDDYFEGVEGSNEHHFNGGIIRENPDWFQEIQDKEFTKDDMFSFAQLYHNHQPYEGATWVESIFKSWLKTRKV